MRAIYVVSIIINDLYLLFRSCYAILSSLFGSKLRGFGSEVLHSGIVVIYIILQKTNTLLFISQ